MPRWPACPSGRHKNFIVAITVIAMLALQSIHIAHASFFEETGGNIGTMIDSFGSTIDEVAGSMRQVAGYTTAQMTNKFQVTKAQINRIGGLSAKALQATAGAFSSTIQRQQAHLNSTLPPLLSKLRWISNTSAFALQASVDKQKSRLRQMASDGQAKLQVKSKNLFVIASSEIQRHHSMLNLSAKALQATAERSVATARLLVGQGKHRMLGAVKTMSQHSMSAARGGHQMLDLSVFALRATADTITKQISNLPAMLQAMQAGASRTVKHLVFDTLGTVRQQARQASSALSFLPSPLSYLSSVKEGALALTSSLRGENAVNDEAIQNEKSPAPSFNVSSAERSSNEGGETNPIKTTSFVAPASPAGPPAQAGKSGEGRIIERIIVKESSPPLAPPLQGWGTNDSLPLSKTNDFFPLSRGGVEGSLQDPRINTLITNVADLTTRVDQQRGDLPANLAGAYSNSALFNMIAQFQRIKTLDDVKITNATIEGYASSKSVSDSYLPLAGGTLTGNLTGTSLSLSDTLGIGTSTPSEKLSINGGVYFDSDIIRISSSSAASLTIKYFSRATTTIPDLIKSAFSFATSTTASPAFFSFDTLNYRVGVGTTSPIATLSVKGSYYLTGGLGIGNATTTSGVLETSSLAYIGGILKGASDFTFAGTGTSTIAGRLEITASSTMAGYKICTQLNDLCSPFTNTGSNVTLRTATDFLGLGTSTPAEKLSINGGIYLDSDIIRISSSSAASLTIKYFSRATTTIPDLIKNAFSFATSTTASPAFFSFDTLNYRVGVGTTSPISTFSVKGGGFLTSLGINNATSTPGELIVDTYRFSVFNSNRIGMFGTSSPILDDGLSLGGSAGTHASLYVSGGLGIGNATTTSGVLETSSLAYIGGILKGASDFTFAGTGTSTIAGRLEITASSTMAGYKICTQLNDLCSPFTNTGSNVTLRTATDFLGLGTSTPSEKLSINGGIYLDSDIIRYGSSSQPTLNFRYFASSTSTLPNLTSAFTFATSTTNTPLLALSTKSSRYGRVGIGTSTPGALFAINALNSSNQAENLFYIGSSTANNFVVDNHGNVGIGTAQPGALLDLYKNSGGSGITEMRISQAFDADGYARLRAYEDSSGLSLSANWAQGTASSPTGDYVGTRDNTARAAAQFGIRLVGTAGGSSFDFAGAFSNTIVSLMRIQLDGNVGIGTTTPAERLSVNGGIYFDSDIIRYGSSSQPTLNFRYFASSTSTLPNLTSAFTFATSTTNTPLLTLSTKSSRYGRVGIGTSSPSALFAINALNSSNQAENLFYIGSSTANNFVVDNHGNVGIGTAAPAAGFQLDVAGTIQFSLGGEDNERVCHNGADAATVQVDLAVFDCLVVGEDFAEYSLVKEETAEPGDVVAIVGPAPEDPTKTLLELASHERGRAIGVISTLPFIDILGDNQYKHHQNSRPIALTGRVPVKVSTDNGPISIGDPLVPSSIPGVAMKGTAQGYTIGYAIEPYDGTVRLTPQVQEQERIHNNPKNLDGKFPYTSDPSQWPDNVGKIMMQSSLGHYKLDVNSGGNVGIGTGAPGWWINQTTGELTSNAMPLNLQGVNINNVNAIYSSSGNWRIGEDGRMVAKEVQTEKLCLGFTCVTEFELQNLLNGSPALPPPPPSVPSPATNPEQIEESLEPEQESEAPAENDPPPEEPPQEDEEPSS